MKVMFNSKTLLLLAGWILAGLASVTLIVQHVKWTEQQTLWQQALGEQEQRVVELETIIADLHLDNDQSGPAPVVSNAASKTGETISNVFGRLRNSLRRAAE